MPVTLMELYRQQCKHTVCECMSFYLHFVLCSFEIVFNFKYQFYIALPDKQLFACQLGIVTH